MDANDAKDHGHESGARGGDHVPHIVPFRAYLFVWLALLALTGITVFVSYFDFGKANIVIALLVATVKASLVAAIFMHLFYDKKFNAIILSFSVIFLVIMIGFTMFDTNYRGENDAIEGVRPRDYTAPFIKGVPDVRVPQAAAKEPEKPAATPVH